jgi:dynein heavy chain 1
MIHEGADLVWDSYKLESYTQKFQDCVFAFQEKVEDLISLDDTIADQVKLLITCPYNYKSFVSILNKIQGSVDEMATTFTPTCNFGCNG